MFFSYCTCKIFICKKIELFFLLNYLSHSAISCCVYTCASTSWAQCLLKVCWPNLFHTLACSIYENWVATYCCLILTVKSLLHLRLFVFQAAFYKFSSKLKLFFLFDKKKNKIKYFTCLLICIYIKIKNAFLLL